MVRPPVKHQGAPADVDLVSFINDFLFNYHHEDPAVPSTLRSSPRCKRYRSMWKAAATSLLAKRSASQGTHSLSEDPLLKSLPSTISRHDGQPFSAGILSKNQPFLDRAGSDSQEHFQNNDVTIDLDAALPLATTRELGFQKDEHCQASSTHVIPKRSSKKPPRPPKVGVLRSGSYRTIRLKTASRRATVDTVRSKKKNMRKSSSNVTVIWSLIITICFVSIMLFQVFFRSDSKRPLSAVQGQGLGEVVSLSPSKI